MKNIVCPKYEGETRLQVDKDFYTSHTIFNVEWVLQPFTQKYLYLWGFIFSRTFIIPNSLFVHCTSNTATLSFLPLYVGIIVHWVLVYKSYPWYLCVASFHCVGSPNPWALPLGWSGCDSHQIFQPSSNPGQSHRPGTPWWSIAWSPAIMSKHFLNKSKQNQESIF